MKEHLGVDKRPLFPGTACYPLSPTNFEKVTLGEISTEANDQLNVILNAIGSPTPEDIEFLHDTPKRAYLLHLKKHEREDFNKKYPAAGADAIDLLNKML